MIVSPKGLLDALRTGAWPPPARAVRCPVKSGNERDPHFQLQIVFYGRQCTLEGLPWITRRKVRATVGPYAVNFLGYTRPTMARTIGCNPERGSQTLKPCLSLDRGLGLTLVKMESLVIACHYRAMNTSLLLAHTARQTIRVGSGRGVILWVASNLGFVRRVKS